MSKPSIERRIFIVGVPRSGTTLVQSLLGAHTAVTSFTESHFFARYFTRLPVPSGALLTRNPAPRVEEFLLENDAAPGDAGRWFSTTGDRFLRWRPLLPFQTRPVARRLLRLLDELALARNTSNWVEKTPRHLRYIPFLEKVAESQPALQFVHVVRQGLEVVASLYAASQSWERPYDLETCIERWNRELAYSASRIGAPRDHFVVYEELASRTEPALKRLLAELGLPWEPGILQRYGQTAARLVTQEESWKADTGRRIHPSGSSGSVLTADQRDRVVRSLRDDLYRDLVAASTQESGKVALSG